MNEKYIIEWLQALQSESDEQQKRIESLERRLSEVARTASRAESYFTPLA